METNNTLGRYFGQNQAQGAQTSLADVAALETYYLNLMGSQLYYRLPVVSNLNAIDTSLVKNIAQFCLAVAPTVHETWKQGIGAMIGAEGTAAGPHVFGRKSA